MQVMQIAVARRQAVVLVAGVGVVGGEAERKAIEGDLRRPHAQTALALADAGIAQRGLANVQAVQRRAARWLGLRQRVRTSAMPAVSIAAQAAGRAGDRSLDMARQALVPGGAWDRAPLIVPPLRAR